MVARPPIAVAVERMTVADLAAVQEIEKRSFTVPWPQHAYRHELETNKLAHYLVARVGERIVGFCGIWILVDEAHITTFATHPDWRRLGVGERMLLAALDLSATRGAVEATLEVRPSLVGAQRLYEKFGFKVVGVRPRYYSDNGEDALIMTTESLESDSMRDRLEKRRQDLMRRPDLELGRDGMPVRTGEPDGENDGDEGKGMASASGGDGAGGAGGGYAAESSAGRIIRPSGVTRKSL
jgi:ribosomal-protein-alanine N-acetyltransferase